MPYIRVTLAKPRPERVAEVRRHYEEIVRHTSTLPGFISGWVLLPHDTSGEVGRMTMWQSQADANNAANDAHTLSLHAEVQFDVFGDMWDRSFDGYVPERVAGSG